jgi:hypothetical protein
LVSQELGVIILMSLLKRVLVLSVLLLSMAVPAWAQKETQTVITLTGGYALTAPEGWEVQEWDGQGTLLANDDASVLAFSPEELDALLSDSARRSAARALIAAYDGIYGDRIASGDIEVDSFAGYDAAMWFFTVDNDADGVFVVIALDDERFAAFDLVAPPPAFEAARADVELMAATLGAVTMITEGSGGGLSPVTAGTAGSGLQPVTVSTEPCTVSVETRDTARLRVGPGFNRTAVAFLPPGVSVDVVGQSADDDGNVWYQLVKDQAAPNSAASEIWVLAEEVDAEGGCASVEVVAGSAIIPIAPPPAPPATTTTAGSGEAPPAVSGGSAPLSGTWTVTFARQSNASCEGFANVVLPTQDMWTNWLEANFVWTANLSANGTTSFTFDGDVYRANGGNEYVGNWEFGGGSNTYLYWRVNSPTSMSGTMTGNIVDGGVPCSVSTSFSAVRR